MDLLTIIFILIYLFSLGALIFLGYFQQLKKEKKYTRNLSSTNENSISLKDLIVIIPFRDEEKRIMGLLKSISDSNELPKEIVFIDDHSEDKTIELIKTNLHGVSYRILQLPIGMQGKKQAIRFAISNSTSDFILSLDADIEFSSKYFSKLKELENADMYILPAILKAKKWFEHLYEVDLLLVNAANCGLSGWKRPIMASGANLMYKRSSFDHFDDFESHSHMQSGDDIYLLRDFRIAKADVRLVTDPSLGIYTETPQSFKEFIHQRLRWIAKTGDVKDHLSSILAILQAVFTFVFVFLFIYLIVIAAWKELLIIYLLKSVIDMLVFLPYFLRIKRRIAWLFIPIYEVLFPIYTLLILGMMFWFKPTWKGRK